MSRLVAFTGAAGAGKSTAAQALVDAGWQRVKFADPLKNMLRQLYRDCGLSDVDIEDRVEGSAKEMYDGALLGVSPRHAMQTLGTEWGRDCIHADLWVHAWERKVRGLLADGVGVVTDDCRFGNEAEAVRRLSGQICCVAGRGGIPGSHASENGIREVDVTLHNLASRDQFMRDVRYVFDTDFFD